MHLTCPAASRSAADADPPSSDMPCMPRGRASCRRSRFSWTASRRSVSTPTVSCSAPIVLSPLNNGLDNHALTATSCALLALQLYPTPALLSPTISGKALCHWYCSEIWLCRPERLAQVPNNGKVFAPSSQRLRWWLLQIRRSCRPPSLGPLAAAAHHRRLQPANSIQFAHACAALG